MRTTMDIDANITGMNFEKDKINEMIGDILSIEIDDNVIFEVEKNVPIKEDNEYGGYRFKLIAKLSNLKIPFSIDISTGDLITPRAVEYKYKTILENNQISLYTYNYETIIAEKFETVLKRNISNSRMKDYYDLYYFVTYKWNDIDKATLEVAVDTTFKHRKSKKYLDKYNEIILNLSNDKNLLERWNKYRKEHTYAKEVEFEDTIKAIEDRRSIRKYKDVKVSKEQILDILNAGRLAPSAKNRQPWYFVKVSTEMKNEIANLMIKYAQNKNKDGRLYSVSFTANVIKEAPVLILILKSNDDEWDRYDTLSVGAAIENMCLRSTELNLGTLWIGDTDFVENGILDMTKHNDMELVSSLVIGYPNQEPKMRPRKDLEEIVEYYE